MAAIFRRVNLRQTKNMVRFLSKSVETETHGMRKEVTKKTTKDGYVEKIMTTFIKPSPKTKFGLGVYCIGFMATSMQSTYNAGKSALIQHRQKEHSNLTEFKVIQNACNHEMLDSVWSGIVWPFTWT
jgi:hypothetical protein